MYKISLCLSVYERARASERERKRERERERKRKKEREREREYNLYMYRFSSNLSMFHLNVLFLSRCVYCGQTRHLKVKQAHIQKDNTNHTHNHARQGWWKRTVLSLLCRHLKHRTKDALFLLLFFHHSCAPFLATDKRSFRTKTNKQTNRASLDVKFGMPAYWHLQKRALIICSPSSSSSSLACQIHPDNYNRGLIDRALKTNNQSTSYRPIWVLQRGISFGAGTSGDTFNRCDERRDYIWWH